MRLLVAFGLNHHIEDFRGGAFRQQIFYVTKAQSELKPDCLLNNLRREPVPP